MQKLIIKNLGPIKNCEMEVRPFTIFIGESGSGKSILLRTISMLKWVYKQVQYKRLLEHIGEIESERIIDIKPQRIMQESKLDDYIDNNTTIEFFIDNELVIAIKNNRFEIKENNILEDNSILSVSAPLLLSKIVFLDENRSILPEMNSASRINYFSGGIGRRNTLSIHTMDMLNVFDEAFNEIGDGFHIETTKIVFRRSKKNERLLFNREQIFVEKNGHKVKFENSSSGEKSSSIIELIGYYFSEKYNLPERFNKSIYYLLSEFFLSRKNDLSKLNEYDILQRLLQLSNNIDKKELLTLLIEEPESNLFPTNQKNLTCFLSSLRKMKNNPEIIFSTHSPYILTVVNNLLYADELANKNSELKEKVNAVIPEKYQLSIDDLSAYVVKNGTVESIIDKETNLINGEYIDSVSDKIMDDFNQLSEIE